MTSGAILFFVIMAILVLVIVATIIDACWRGRKEK